PRAAPLHAVALCIAIIFTAIPFLVWIGLIDAAGPLPDVATHIQRPDPRRPCRDAAHVCRALTRTPIPDHFATVERIAPGVEQTIWPARRVFPFHLSRQALSAFGAEVPRLKPGDQFHRALVCLKIRRASRPSTELRELPLRRFRFVDPKRRVETLF